MKKVTFFLTLLILFTSSYTYSQWVQQTIPLSKPITGIKFIDSLKGWACTGNLSNPQPSDTNAVIHTTNGGANWVIQLRLNTIFSPLSVIDSLNVNVAGYKMGSGIMKIYKSTNGGQSWDTLTMVPNMLIDDMQFLNKDSAWECGASAGPDVRSTTDGGNNWIVRTTGIMSTTQKLFFFNYNTGFCGAGRYLYRTTNTGLNWTFLYSFGNDDIHGIFFININTGWVGINEGKIGATTNGGLNWNIQQPNPMITDLTYDIYFIENIGWAGTGWFRKIFKTTNNGETWGYQNDSSGSFKISFVDTLNGWSGFLGNGFISHTTNGGGPITDVGIVNKNGEILNKYILYQNYPNPFNSQTTIKFSIQKPSYVKLKIYDILGKQKMIWESPGLLKKGTHELNIDAKELSSGVYFYQLTVTNEQLSVVYKETRKMILIK